LGASTTGGMTGTTENDTSANALCKSCGLCCTGHLFTWVRLNASELEPSQKLGLNVIRNDPRQRGFTQPCPLWNGICTIYTSPNYPRGCRSYKCKLLKGILEDNAPLQPALMIVQQAKELIAGVEPFLPASATQGFRECFVQALEDKNNSAEFRAIADEILVYLENYFGVDDFFSPVPDE
jgi:hypothetical protein